MLPLQFNLRKCAEVPEEGEEETKKKESKGSGTGVDAEQEGAAQKEGTEPLDKEGTEKGQVGGQA